MKVVVTGATGFVGQALCRALIARGDAVISITRDPVKASRALPAGVSSKGWSDLAAVVDGADGVVNLAGEPIAQRWTAAAKELIVKSRVDAVERLRGALSAATGRPSVVVNASAVGFYGARGDEELTEESAGGADFVATTTRAWEDAARSLESKGTRLVLLRTGIVLGPEGGALAKMLPPFRLGVGGPLGSGKQWMSWIHRDDLVALLLWALGNPAVAGVVNATAPNPVRMSEFAPALAKALHRPCLIGPPAAVLRLLLGEMATIVVDGQRVLPRRAEDLGFTFRFPHVAPALKDLLAA